MNAVYSFGMQRDVAAFHRAFGLPDLVASPGALPRERVELRLGLIREEGVLELRQAIQTNDPVSVIDALIDTAYVALGALVEMGYTAADRVETDVPRPKPNIADLMDNARAVNISNETYLAMLATALERQDAVRSVEILDTIQAGAIFAMLTAGFDPQPFFDEVHRANMSKLGTDGAPVFSRGQALDGYPVGKVLKGPAYTPPQLARVFEQLYVTPGATRGSSVTPDFEHGARAALETLQQLLAVEHDLQRTVAQDDVAELAERVLALIMPEQHSPTPYPPTRSMRLRV